MTDLDWLREAYRHAREHSTDPSTQNAALLVNGGSTLLVAGANHFPRGVAESLARWERPAKYQYVEHAERNAVYEAARLGIRTDRLTMYCPWVACADCARAIIQAGITEVVGHDFDLHRTSAHWLESIAVADAMLAEAGVRLRRVPGKVSGVTIRFNGAEVEP